MNYITYSLSIFCFQTGSKFMYEPLKRSGVLSLTPLEFADDKVFDLCNSLSGLTFTTMVTIQSGHTLKSTPFIYGLNASLELTLICDGDLARKALCHTQTMLSKQATYSLMFLGINTQISQTIASYNVNVYNHEACYSDGLITFDSSIVGFKFSATSNGCNLQSTQFETHISNPPADSVTITLSMFDQRFNKTISVTQQITNDVLADQLNPLVVFNYLSSNNPEVLTFYDALLFNLIYRIKATFKYKMIPRQNDAQVYYMRLYCDVKDITVSNFPKCYTTLRLQASTQGYFVYSESSGLCTEPVHDQVVVKLGVASAQSNFSYQVVNDQFLFSRPFMNLDCNSAVDQVANTNNSAKCKAEVVKLQEQSDLYALFQITFMLNGAVVNSYQQIATRLPACFSQIQAELKKG